MKNHHALKIYENCYRPPDPSIAEPIFVAPEIVVFPDQTAALEWRRFSKKKRSNEKVKTLRTITNETDQKTIRLAAPGTVVG